jgi:hypothetical protein
MSADLSKYNAAKKALAEAYRIDEVKDIRDKAVAMRMYALQARDRVLIDQATEIRLRAERRAGQLLKEMEKNAGSRGSGSNQHKVRSHDATAPKLSDLGINKSQSSRWQKLADIDDDEFEEVVTHAQHKASDAVDHAQQPKPKPNPNPKPKPEQPRRKHRGANSGDPIATCLAEVTPVIRAAIVKMDAERRLVFLDELRKAIRTIVTEVTAQDADTDRWTETAH